MSDQLSAEKDECRCQIVGWSRDPYEPHIPARAEWEQADDCPVHPLPSATVTANTCACGTATIGDAGHLAWPWACINTSPGGERRVIRENAQPVRLTSAERDAMREAAEDDQRDPRGNDGVAMVKAVERIIWDRLYVVSSPAMGSDQ